MGMVYTAYDREEFEWAMREWFPKPKGFSGRVEVRMAPWFTRMLIALELRPRPLTLYARRFARPEGSEEREPK